MIKSKTARIASQHKNDQVYFKMSNLRYKSTIKIMKPQEISNNYESAIKCNTNMLASRKYGFCGRELFIMRDLTLH